MEPVMELVMEPVIETVVEPVIETVVEPVVEPVMEPVVEPVMEPMEKPVEKLVIKPLVRLIHTHHDQVDSNLIRESVTISNPSNDAASLPVTCSNSILMKSPIPDSQPLIESQQPFTHTSSNHLHDARGMSEVRQAVKGTTTVAWPAPRLKWHHKSIDAGNGTHASNLLKTTGYPHTRYLYHSLNERR